ncbi:hypothetical protein ABPG74_015449 [Tetrahymena malaccensis]
MREIINIQIGNAGNQIGLDFWEALKIEHSLDCYGNLSHSTDYQQEKLDVYFFETINGSYCARSIQVDSDPDFMNQIQLSQTQNLFDQSSFVNGDSCSGNNFSKGYVQLELKDQALEAIRLQAEQCDNLQGLQLIRSLGGGTGSGFGSLMLQNLNDFYPKSIISNFCIFPYPGVNDIIVEPYNTVLSLPTLHSLSDICFSFHNGALYNILMKIIGNNTPSLKDLNGIVKQSISGVTALWRFPCQISSDMRKFAMNLISFPNLNYINIGLAPLCNKSYIPKKEMSLSEIFKALENNRNSVNHCRNIEQLVEFSSNYVFRKNNIQEEDITNLYRNEGYNQPLWIPDSKQMIQISQRYLNQHQQTALKIQSGSSVKEMLQSQLDSFNCLYKRKAFVSLYDNIDQMEFLEAKITLENIISDYNYIENCKNNFKVIDENHIQNNLTQFQQDSNSFTSINF